MVNSSVPPRAWFMWRVQDYLFKLLFSVIIWIFRLHTIRKYNWQDFRNDVSERLMLAPRSLFDSSRTLATTSLRRVSSRLSNTATRQHAHDVTATKSEMTAMTKFELTVIDDRSGVNAMELLPLKHSKMCDHVLYSI